MDSLKELKEFIEELGYEDVLLFENFDYITAFIGMSECGRAVYDYDKMVGYLIKKEGMKKIDAIEFIDFNTIRSLPYYKNHPIIVNIF